MAKTQSTFPTTIDNTLQVDRAAGDTITSESYDIIEDALFGLETKVGVDTSAVATTLDYKLTNAASIDPGHLHTGDTASGSSIVSEPFTAVKIEATSITATTASGFTRVYTNAITASTATIINANATVVSANTVSAGKLVMDADNGGTGKICTITVTGTTASGFTDAFTSRLTADTIDMTDGVGKIKTKTVTATTASGFTDLYAATITGTTIYGDTISGDIKTIVFDIPGTAAAGTFQTTSFIVPMACTITKAYLYQRTASTGTTTLTVDIHKTGTSIWSGDQTKRLSASTGVVSASQTSFTTTALVETDRLDIDFDNVGSTVAGANITVELKVVT